MRASTQDIIRTSRPSAARLALLAARHATKTTQNLRWLAAHSSGWVHEMWLAAIDVQCASAPCLHEEVTLICPFGCAGTVDEDFRVCQHCGQAVDPIRFCESCEEPVGTLGDYERATWRDVPRHMHTWVLDAAYIDVPDIRERCTTCPAVRELMPHEQIADAPTQGTR